MDEAEFEAWLHGTSDEYTYEGMQCLVECCSCDSEPAVSSALASPETVVVTPLGTIPESPADESTDEALVDLTETVEVTPLGTIPESPAVDGEDGGGTLEIIGMMADGVICQSCHRQIAQYQCT